MNVVFTTDEKLKVKLKLVMGSTCGKIEDLTEELEDISVDTNNKSNLTNLLDKEIINNKK